jgi:hypothetical protein
MCSLLILDMSSNRQPEQSQTNINWRSSAHRLKEYDDYLYRICKGFHTNVILYIPSIILLIFK